MMTRNVPIRLCFMIKSSVLMCKLFVKGTLDFYAHEICREICCAANYMTITRGIRTVSSVCYLHSHDVWDKTKHPINNQRYDLSG